MTRNSKALETRVTDLQRRMQAASVSVDDMQAFERVADLLENRRGSIDGDDLVALSFVTSDEL
ncbi:hypothetical protein ACVDG8_029470 [Mesorhizobium sp. ORM8.1]